MTYRFAGRAEDQIDQALLEGARRWGIETAGRYNRLILAALSAIGNLPDLPGSREVPDFPGLRIYHLRSARGMVDRQDRIAAPRHLVIYRVASDGVVEILSLCHDRMLLERAMRRAVRDARRGRPSNGD